MTIMDNAGGGARLPLAMSPIITNITVNDALNHETP